MFVHHVPKHAKPQLVRQETIKIEQKPSPIEGQGLFARFQIQAGEIIGGQQEIGLINDGVFKIKNELNVSTFVLQNEHYEQISEIKKRVNCRILEIDGEVFVQAINSIQPGQELTRYYGIDNWLMTAIAKSSRDTYSELFMAKSEKLSMDLTGLLRIEKYLQLLESRYSPDEFQEFKNIQRFRKMNLDVFTKLISVD